MRSETDAAKARRFMEALGFDEFVRGLANDEATHDS
jgi:hypothetical protein